MVSSLFDSRVQSLELDVTFSEGKILNSDFVFLQLELCFNRCPALSRIGV
jgi:hypothetical protein